MFSLLLSCLGGAQSRTRGAQIGGRFGSRVHIHIHTFAHARAEIEILPCLLLLLRLKKAATLQHLVVSLSLYVRERGAWLGCSVALHPAAVDGLTGGRLGPDSELIFFLALLILGEM